MSSNGGQYSTAYNRFRSLGADPGKKEVIMYVGGLLLSAFLITSGALLISDQETIKSSNPDKSSVLNNTLGSIQVVVGSLVVIYLLFRFFTK